MDKDTVKDMLNAHVNEQMETVTDNQMLILSRIRDSARKHGFCDDEAMDFARDWWMEYVSSVWLKARKESGLSE